MLGMRPKVPTVIPLVEVFGGQFSRQATKPRQYLARERPSERGVPVSWVSFGAAGGHPGDGDPVTASATGDADAWSFRPFWWTQTTACERDLTPVLV